MQVEEVLKEAENREITREEALRLFQEVQGWEQALRLFQTASRVRDREVGRKVSSMGFLASITRCTTKPPCSYCFKWNSPDVFTPKDVLSEQELADAARAMEQTGIRHVELGGGTVWEEEGSATTLAAVKAVTGASNLGVWVNNGPSFPPSDVPRFKELGAEGVACGLETISERLYQQLRPGDNLQARKEIVETTDNVGLGIDNTLMIGLGEQWEDGHPYQEWVDFLFYFKRFKNFRILEANPFRPVPGSPVEGYPAGSSFEAAKAKAIARLVFRDIDLAGADEVLGLLAGANQIMHAVCVSRRGRMGPGLSWGRPSVTQIGDNLVLRNYLPSISRHLEEFGMELE